MTYRDVCADHYGGAQLNVSNINGLDAKLRGHFI
jgi:hypothetical protein